jgi:hypothetical protein
MSCRWAEQHGNLTAERRARTAQERVLMSAEAQGPMHGGPQGPNRILGWLATVRRSCSSLGAVDRTRRSPPALRGVPIDSRLDLVP